MGSIRNRYLPFREAYDAYAERVERPVTEGAVRRWLLKGVVPALKRGNAWSIQVQEIIRYHINVIGVGKKGKKGRLRRERITPVSKYQLDESQWAPHIEAFLKTRQMVRPRQILDLVGVPPSKLSPEVSHWIRAVKELLGLFGWEQMPPPHRYDWAPRAVVRKAKMKVRSKARSPKEVAKQTRAVLRWLKAGGMYSLPEIRKHFDLSESQVKTIVYPLVDSGKIAVLGQSTQTMYYHP